MRVAPTRLTEADPDPVVQAIVARRGGKFIELDKALLVSPPFARGWNAFIGAVRSSWSCRRGCGSWPCAWWRC